MDILVKWKDGSQSVVGDNALKKTRLPFKINQTVKMWSKPDRKWFYGRVASFKKRDHNKFSSRKTSYKQTKLNENVVKNEGLEPSSVNVNKEREVVNCDQQPLTDSTSTVSENDLGKTETITHDSMPQVQGTPHAVNDEETCNVNKDESTSSQELNIVLSEPFTLPEDFNTFLKPSEDEQDTFSSDNLNNENGDKHTNQELVNTDLQTSQATNNVEFAEKYSPKTEAQSEKNTSKIHNDLFTMTNEEKYLNSLIKPCSVSVERNIACQLKVNEVYKVSENIKLPSINATLKSIDDKGQIIKNLDKPCNLTQTSSKAKTLNEEIGVKSRTLQMLTSKRRKISPVEHTLASKHQNSSVKSNVNKITHRKRRQILHPDNKSESALNTEDANNEIPKHQLKKTLSVENLPATTSATIHHNFEGNADNTVNETTATKTVPVKKTLGKSDNTVHDMPKQKKTKLTPIEKNTSETNLLPLANIQKENQSKKEQYYNLRRTTTDEFIDESFSKLMNLEPKPYVDTVNKILSIIKIKQAPVKINAETVLIPESSKQQKNVSDNKPNMSIFRSFSNEEFIDTSFLKLKSLEANKSSSLQTTKTLPVNETSGKSDDIVHDTPKQKKTKITPIEKNTSETNLLPLANIQKENQSKKEQYHTLRRTSTNEFIDESFSKLMNLEPKPDVMANISSEQITKTRSVKTLINLEKPLSSKRLENKTQDQNCNSRMLSPIKSSNQINLNCSKLSKELKAPTPGTKENSKSLKSNVNETFLKLESQDQIMLRSRNIKINRKDISSPTSSMAIKKANKNYFKSRPLREILPKPTNKDLSNQSEQKTAENQLGTYTLHQSILSTIIPNIDIRILQPQEQTIDAIMVPIPKFSGEEKYSQGNKIIANNTPATETSKPNHGQHSDAITSLMPPRAISTSKETFCNPQKPALHSELPESDKLFKSVTLTPIDKSQPVDNLPPSASTPTSNASINSDKPIPTSAKSNNEDSSIKPLKNKVWRPNIKNRCTALQIERTLMLSSPPLEEKLDGAPPFIQEVFKCENIRDGFINSDLMFVLSLLPDLEEMTDTQKINFQLKVVNILNNVLNT